MGKGSFCPSSLPCSIVSHERACISIHPGFPPSTLSARSSPLAGEDDELKPQSAQTTLDFGTFIGIETPAELANLFAGHALIGTGMRGGIMQHLKKRTAGGDPAVRIAQYPSLSLLRYGLLGVSGTPAGAATCSNRKFLMSRVLLPSPSLYAWPGLTLYPLLSPEILR